MLAKYRACTPNPSYSRQAVEDNMISTEDWGLENEWGEKALCPG